jgi:hypothetical protein
MSCNNCNQECNCNTQETCIQQDCSCPILDFPTSCIKYTGPQLECSEVDTDLPLDEVLEQMDKFICSKFDFLSSYFQLINIGEGAKIYKGDNLVGQKQLRTIISQDLNLMDVIESTDTIGLKPGSYELTLDGDDLILTVETNAGVTIKSTIDLSGYTANTYLQASSFNEGTQVLTLDMNDIADYLVDLSFLNNHLESVNYDDSTNTITFTLTDSTEFNLDIDAILADAQVKSDFIETDSSSPAFIENKNPTKSETLGSGATYTVIAGDNNYVIEIDNGANDVTIDITALAITDNFIVGFIQKGTGTVTFTGYDIITTGLDNTLVGQGCVASFQIINSTKYLMGQLNLA